MAKAFSQADMNLVCAVIRSLKGVPDVDWSHVALEGKYANANSARRQWDHFKARNGLNKDATKKRKEGEGEEGGDGEAAAMPVKKARATKKGGGKKAKDAAAPSDEEEVAIKREEDGDGDAAI